MKSQKLLFCALLPFLFIHHLNSQCTSFVNDPLTAIVGIPDCGLLTFTEIEVQQAHAYLLPGLEPNSIYHVDICNSSFPLPPEQMELVVMDQFNNVIAFDFNCFIEFEPPSPGDYLFVFNAAGNCGIPNELITGFGIQVNRECFCFADRQQAIEFILDPLSGIDFQPALSTMWSPFVDFGFGPGFEGLVPQGTIIAPGCQGCPNPGPTITAPFDGYFIWIDDQSAAKFEHPTRFVLLDPADCAPSLSGGSILELPQMWWPELTIPDSIPVLHFNRDLVSPFPPGPFNPDGLLTGDWLLPTDLVIEPSPPANNSTSKSAGLVVSGDDRSDMRGDIPRWRKQLQDKDGVDSTRILGSSSDSAVTKQVFCDLLDSLCTIQPAADTFFIRITSHGFPGWLKFSDGWLTAKQLCTKFKKLAQKGVPIMLLIDACHSSSLYDANNWGFPAGSMIVVAATSGNSAYGYTASEADSDGNPIPGTSFTGGMLSTAHINCKNDTTDLDNNNKADADTNEDGDTDDCEAFNWIETQRPCFVRNVGPFNLGSYIINKYAWYPAGPPVPIMMPDSVFPDGTIIKDGVRIRPNPGPSYRAVGNFGSSMNWNVENMTGADKDLFYMVFAGNVSLASGKAWTSTSSDSITGTWAEAANVTATYDAVKDETTACWMASGAAASNGDFVHFGYFGGGLDKLRPKRQFWDSSNNFTEISSLVDHNSVPSTESSILLDGSGSTLVVRTINLNAFQGGTGHPVNYTIGYRISPVEVPLENLTQSDPLVSNLPLILVQSGVLDTNGIFEFQLDIPDDMQVGKYFILQVELDWTLNGNTNDQLVQWSALSSSICDDDILYIAGEQVPHQSNSNGTITLESVSFDIGVTTLNAAGGVFAKPGAIITLPTGATVFVYDYGCDGGGGGAPPAPLQGGKQMFIGSNNEILFKDIEKGN